MNWKLSSILSFIIVAFGQSSWIPLFGMISAMGGYALFWQGMLQIKRPLHRFFLSVIWFMAVQGVQLSWMTSTHYMGGGILIVYGLLILGLGAQFGILSSFLSRTRSLSHFGCVALAGGWVCFEWMRIYLLTGFTWNPVGLSLASHHFPTQLAAFIGIYGLSFWVIWTNLLVLKGHRICIFVILFPYVLGAFYQLHVNRIAQFVDTFQAALVDTALLVEEKYEMPEKAAVFIDPLEQWERVFDFLQIKEPLDLIVLPEVAFPFGDDTQFCPYSLLCETWLEHFGQEALASLPPITSLSVSNTYIAQALANEFQADVVMGLEINKNHKQYNAALHFRPGSDQVGIYKKRVLVPVGEYIPFADLPWVRKFLKDSFQIENSFTSGTESVIFPFKIPLGIAICLEEVYPEIIRDLRCKGAQILVSLSNDVWFPFSKLGQQHWDHGRIRAVENGFFLLRAANMGCTGAIDYFGKALQISENQAGAQIISIPMISYQTWYSKIGVIPIVFVSFFCFIFFLIQKILEEKVAPK